MSAVFTEEWLAAYQQKRQAETTGGLMQGTRVLAARKDEFQRLSRSMTQRQLAVHFKVSIGSVGRYLRELALLAGQVVRQPSRLKGLSRGTKLLDGKEAEFVELQGSMTIEQLAARFGLSEPVISRFRRKLGLRGTYGLGERGKLAANKNEFLGIHDSFSDAHLSAHFGVSISCIQKWRASLGIKKEQSRKWERSPHPKGATGLTHSAESRSAMSRASVAMWSDPNHVVHSDAYRQRRSDQMVALQASGSLRQNYSRGSMGRRPDLGNVYFRSSWEANYARYLNLLIRHGKIYRWEFEADTFWFEAIKRGVRSYKPDFKIWETAASVPYYVEIKGWMDSKSKTKLDRMARHYPAVRVDVVEHEQYKAIARSVSSLIPQWESRLSGRLQQQTADVLEIIPVRSSRAGAKTIVQIFGE